MNNHITNLRRISDRIERLQADLDHEIAFILKNGDFSVKNPMVPVSPEAKQQLRDWDELATAQIDLKTARQLILDYCNRKTGN